jgi:uncharacterized protein
MWEQPQIQRLKGSRLHLQQGPIDLVLKAWGSPTAIAAAEAAAVRRFQFILAELVAELPDLRMPAMRERSFNGPVARRMLAACLSHWPAFLTPMAAVAGSVADEVLAAMIAAAPLTKAFVNNGGDIALHLAPHATLKIGIAADFSGGPIPALDGAIRLMASDGIGGIATSGAQGRSFSLGIADSVTVLAANGAAADAAATLVANAVDLPGHLAIRRAPASSLDPDSDLREKLVTLAVPPLATEEIRHALAAGKRAAQALIKRGLIRAAALSLQGNTVVAMPRARQDWALQQNKRNVVSVSTIRMPNGGREQATWSISP